MSTDSMRFGFGKNWESYIKRHFSEERVDISRRKLLTFLQLETLKGSAFLDIGCGSGLHSLAALRAGADRIVSFDLDPNSVETTKKLKAWAGNPPTWQVTEGSILDGTFLGTLEPAEIVYSWGVLHHTGNMWQAMDNVFRLIKPGGLAYLALYDYDTPVNPSAEFWLDVKKRYNHAGWWGRRRLELWYIWKFYLHNNILNLPVFMVRIFGYKQIRGMSIYTDLVDWLGGWPMEYSKRADVKKWAQKNSLEMLTMKTGEANTEYLFKKPKPLGQ